MNPANESLFSIKLFVSWEASNISSFWSSKFFRSPGFKVLNFFNNIWVGDSTFLRTIFQKLGSLIFNWLSDSWETNLLLENWQDPLISEYLAILEFLAMISSTFPSKKCSFYWPSKNPNIPFFNNVSISSFEILFSDILSSVSLKLPPIKIALSNPSFWVAR